MRGSVLAPSGSIIAQLFSVVTKTHREVVGGTRGMARLFPAERARLRDGVPAAERDGDFTSAYRRLLEDADALVRERTWCTREDTHVSLQPGHQPSPRYRDPRFRMAFARLMTHYWRHAAWLEDGILLRNVGRLAGIPGVLVQGKLDVSDPPDVAWYLSQVWPEAGLLLINEAGHGAGLPGMDDALIAATDRFARRIPIATLA